MADRFTVSEVQQVGIESSPGSAATPTVQFNGLNFDIDTDLEVDEFSPAGQLPQSIVAPRQEWASGSHSGYPTYNEIQYPISNILGAATISTPSGATNTRRWLWEPDESTPWTPKTFTLRRGVPSGLAEEANYLLLSGFGFSFSRTAPPELSGDLFAQRLTYAASLATTGITVQDDVPILPVQGDVYLDSASGSLGSTKLLRDFEFSWSIADLFGMIWPINSSNASFAAHSVMKPTIEAMLRLGNDAVGQALITNMRAGSTVWVRFRATGATDSIETSFAYRFTIDLPLKVVQAPSRADEEGLSTLEWTFRNVYDSGWGKWVSIELLNKVAAL